MKTLRFTPQLQVYMSESGRFNWAQHERDRQLPFRPQFITYIGGESKEQLRAFLAGLEFTEYQVRSSKRLGTPWEAKVYGLAWDVVRYLPFSLVGRVSPEQIQHWLNAGYSDAELLQAIQDLS